jgi:hypothetical protein
MVLGKTEEGDELKEVDLLKDDPRGILDEILSPIELKAR